MNKIVLDKEYYHFNDEEINAIITKKNVTLELDGNIKINDLESKEDINLKLILNDNANVIFNKFNKDIANANIKIIVNNNTNLNFNYSVYNTLESSFKIDANILGNNNNTYINFYGVSNLKGKFVCDVTSSVEKDIFNNDLLENIRILSLNDEQNIILPNLLVSSDNVSINHNATISGLDKDYLFYLESKGLDQEEASKLITRGFIFSKLDLSKDEKEKIKF